MNFLKNIPTWLIVLAFLALSMAVRLLNINSTDIAGDEPFSIFMAQFDVGSIIKHLGKDNSPPVFEILLNFYVLVFGNSDCTLRLLPTILNALIVVPIIFIGQKFFNRTVAITAALMFVLCIYQIRFAHEIRVYSLFSLAFAWNIFFLLSAIKKPNHFLVWIALVLTNLLLLYSHYTSFYILFAQVVCLGFFLPRVGRKFALISLLVTMVGYSPYMLVFLGRLGQVSGTGTWVPTPGWGEIYGNINLLLNSKIATLFVMIAIGLGAVLSAKKDGFKYLFERVKTRSGMSLIILFSLTYVPMFFVSVFFLPMFMDRYVLYTSIPLILSIAWLTDLVWSRQKLSWIGPVLLVSGALITTNLNPPNHRNIKQVSLLIKQLNQPNTKIYVCPEMFKLGIAFHAYKQIFQSIDPANPLAKLDSAFASNEVHFIKSKNQLQLGDAEKVVYLDAASEFVHPENQVLGELESRFNLVEKHHIHEIFDVYIFSSAEE